MGGMWVELLKIFSIARKWPAIDQNKYSNAMGLARKFAQNWPKDCV